MRWQNWCAYVKHMGVDPYLQQVPYATRVRCLTGFAARTRTGFYGYGRQVQSSTVTGAITAVCQTIALACNENPTKILGSKTFLPALQIMLDGYMKADPPTQKNFLRRRTYPSCWLRWVMGKQDPHNPRQLSLPAAYAANRRPPPPPPPLLLPPSRHHRHRHHHGQTHRRPLPKKEATAAPPPAYQRQHQHENIYKSC